jgi:Arc/MetJ family transcription regulator
MTNCAEAMTLGGQKTKRQAVEDGLRAFIRARRQDQAMKNLDGIGWDGDLEEIRGGPSVIHTK